MATRDISSTIYRLPGLQPNTSYSVKIMAVSKLGEGLWSVTPLKFTTAEIGKLCNLTLSGPGYFWVPGSGGGGRGAESARGKCSRES